ncbi:MAG: peptidoglycan DD-metalloendopeptidase family protein [Paludibacteraceae bacterium]|nr:peptidoglycan DD-metalloendopeptidase family protein [Paludibacteraceae bacterium]
MAKKIKFHFNPETLNYEPVILTLTHRIKQIALHLFSGISLGALFFFVFVSIFDSPEEKQLELEKNRIQAQYKVLERRLDEVQQVLNDIQQRDDNLYRVILQAEPIPLSVRRAISANTDYYEQLLRMTNSEIVVSTTKKVNELRKQIYIQSKSFDDLIVLSKNKETMLEHIPAIQPVLNKDLKRMASGYGWRIDPVYRTRRFHAGMDFTAPTGTDIYATGNGTVQSAGWKQGYGNTVEINHGFGYLTLYAHMHKINVKPGQKVKRGEVIGLVGNTGKSTGPHLHYEVHFKGQVMNPANYYFLDLSPEEYDQMVQMSNNSGMMMD